MSGEARDGSAHGRAPAPLSRAALAQRIERVLSRGGAGQADVLLVRTDGGPAVVKDFGRRGGPLRRALGRWLARRELRAYRALSGLPAVPRLLAVIDPLAFAVEYRPGPFLSRSLRGRVPPGFLGELRAAVEAMHARGVAHLDLRHRSNVLADAEGHPVLLDFASAVCVRPGGWAARWVLPWLMRIDARALRKWEVRLSPQAGSSGASAAESASGTGSEGSRGASRPM